MAMSISKVQRWEKALGVGPRKIDGLTDTEPEWVICVGSSMVVDDGLEVASMD